MDRKQAYLMVAAELAEWAGVAARAAAFGDTAEIALRVIVQPDGSIRLWLNQDVRNALATQTGEDAVQLDNPDTARQGLLADDDESGVDLTLLAGGG